MNKEVETMKRQWVLTIFIVLLMSGFYVQSPVFAFDSGSTGADGAFEPTTNTEVQLPEDGILNYTTVNIPAEVTVTFKKNTSNTPVYILATGDVTIAGNINVNGMHANVVSSGKGGPGGFDGGLGAYPGSCGGTSPGPGGGQAATEGTSEIIYYGAGGGGGGFGTAGGNGATYNAAYSTGGVGGETYGNISLLPIIGGSGGGGGCGGTLGGGGAGGGGAGGAGAILIASSGTIDITGSITAKGGNGGVSGTYSGKGGGGSGGAIKLMADVIKGNGTLSATGGSGTAASGWMNGGNGGNGRIRLEANTLLRTTSSTPTYTYIDAPVYVFPPNIPVLNITSIGGITVPDAPTGKYSTPDITFSTSVTNPVEVAIEASNIPVGTTVTVNIVSQLGPSSSTTATLSGTDTSSTATAQVTLSAQYINVIMATATFTLQTASNQPPVYAGGEKVVKMRVASVLGGKSSITYITESGKEIPANL